MDNRYVEKRNAVEQTFSRYSKLDGDEQEFVSPSGQFKFSVSVYGKEGETVWTYSRGIITRVTDGKIIADIKRNIGHFWLAWVQHPNGNEYLLCGEDYQGYSVVNLTQDAYQVYFPEEGYRGAGFCWTAVYPSPDKLVLAVDGCFWACPYEIVFYDFRTPGKLPYKKLGRVKNLIECEGWLNNDTFALTREVDIRKSDGIPYEQLAEEEQEILDTDLSLLTTRKERIEVKRPSFHETH